MEQNQIPPAAQGIIDVIVAILSILKRIEEGDATVHREERSFFLRLQNICNGESPSGALQNDILASVGLGIKSSKTVYADKNRRSFGNTIGRFLNNRGSRTAMAKELATVFLEIKVALASLEENSQTSYFPSRLTPQLASFTL